MSNTTDTSPLSSSSPIEQQQQQQQQAPPQPQPTKRSSRRANTAERRATHNAVERLRRETLNSRFLDLAAMLPALAAQRRPSKSAIVNQSISLLTTQRRNRLIAAREVRLIKTENDALRGELNEWRTRNSLPRVEEPPRSAELLTLLALPEEDEGDEGEDVRRRAAFEMGDEEGFEDDCADEELLSPDSAHPYAGGAATALTIPTVGGGHKVHASVHHHHQQLQQQQAQLQSQQQQAHYAAQQAAVFEQQTAAMVRAQMAAARATYPSQQQQQQQVQQQQQMFTPTEKMYTGTPTDNFLGDMYAPEYNGAPAWSQKAASTLATPPGTSHGHGMKSEPSPYATTANSAFLSSSPYGSGSPYSAHPHSHPFHQHHQLQHHSQHNQQGGGGGGLGMFKPRDDDGDSVGESTGSSHFSSVSDLSATLSNGMMIPGGGAGNGNGNGPSSSPVVDHPFSFNMGGMGMMQMPLNINMGMMPMMGMGMNAMNGMGGGMMGGMSMPSPPHSVSPGGSQPQSRRPSINIPSSYTGNNGGSNGGSKHASPNPSPGPTPTQAQTQFVGMGLMM